MDLLSADAAGELACSAETCLKELPWPAPLQQPLWLNVLSTAFDVTPSAFVARRNGRIMGLLIAYESVSFVSGRSLHTLDCPVGLWPNDVAETLAAAVKVYLKQRQISHAQLNGLTAQTPAEMFSEPRGQACFIDLKCGKEAYFSSLSGRTRNRINRARRAGYSSGFISKKRLPEFYEIYRRRLLAHGVPELGLSLIHI